MFKLPDAQSMTDDEIYLQTYQQVYQLFCLRAQVLYGVPHALENPKVFTQELSIELDQIDREICRFEGDFWLSIERCKQNGKEFFVEKIATLHRLDFFEKRVMLFLIFSRLNQPRPYGYCAEQIIRILDINNSVAERFKNLLYFSGSSPALIKEVLTVSEICPEKAYQISPKIMQQISSLLKGETQAKQAIGE